MDLQYRGFFLCALHLSELLFIQIRVKSAVLLNHHLDPEKIILSMKWTE